MAIRRGVYISPSYLFQSVSLQGQPRVVLLKLDSNFLESNCYIVTHIRKIVNRQVDTNGLICYTMMAMDSLLAPLEQLKGIEIPDMPITVKGHGKEDRKIPIPSMDHLTKVNSNVGKTDSKELTKYSKEYEEFCKWAALPKELRKPKTAIDWEKRNLLPKGYSNYFKSRDDFATKRWTAFWDWMMDLYPDVVYAVYQRASHAKGSDKAAAIFIDLLSKKMNLDQPRVQVQPMVLMGVPQESIDKLFVPKGYVEAEQVIEKGGK